MASRGGLIQLATPRSMSSTPDDTRAWAVADPGSSTAPRAAPEHDGAAPGRPRRIPGGDPVLAGIVVFGALVRFGTLSTQSLWADEGFTAQIAGHSLSSAVSQVPHTESTPPLYYALAWVWAHVFGSSAFALRSLPALLGTLTVAAVFWAGVPLLSRRAALGAAGLTAVSPIMVWDSQEARAYALLALLCVLALGFFVRALRRERRAWLLGWAACSAAALATHYFAVFPLAAEAAWLLVRLRNRRQLFAALALPAVVGAALLPLVLYQTAHVPRPWTGAFTVKDQLEATGQSFLVGITWTPVIHRAGVAVLAVMALAAVVALVRRGDDDERRAGLGLAALAIVTIGVPVVISLVATNYLAPRNVLYAWPILALLVAAGATRRGAGRLSLAALLAACAVCLAIVVAVPLTPALQRADWRDLLAPLRVAGPPRGVVVFDGFDDSPVLRYYVPRLGRLAGPTAVREIDVLTTAAQAPQAARLLPVSGLAPTAVEVRGQIALTRFRSGRAVTLPAAPPPGSGEAYYVVAH
jgi:mannosyltransferase